MNLFAQFNAEGAYSSELEVGYIAATVLACYGLWAFIRWFFTGPLRPDPWDDRIEAEIARDEAVPLCHRCLASHESLANFCSQCGAPVGQYTNWLPFPRLFSIGYTLRLGTSGDFKHSPMVIAGFFLLSIAEHDVFAPVYWFSFLWGLFRRRQPNSTADQPPPDSVE